MPFITPELTSYVRAQLAGGETRDALYKDLIAQGWAVDDIQEALVAVEKAPLETNTTPLMRHMTDEPKKHSIYMIVILPIALIIILMAIGYVGYKYFGAGASTNSPLEQSLQSILPDNAPTGTPVVR